MRWLFITPHYTPTNCGITDHSLLLAGQLRSKVHPINIKLLSFSACEKKQTGPFDTITYLDELDQHELPPFVKEADIIFLQFVLYGYQYRGLPYGLIKLLHSIKNHSPARLLVYFHELWPVNVPITASSFWLYPLHRSICRNIAHLADIIFCNRLQGYHWLAGIKGGNVHFLPTFSNIGEPEINLPWAERKPVVIVFGTPQRRTSVYQHCENPEQVLKMIHCNELLDIGETCNNIPGNMPGAKTVIKGVRAPNEISKLMLNSKFGLFDTEWSVLTKSGIFAAYAAHGIVPLSVRRSGGPDYTDAPLSHGTHFLSIYDDLEQLGAIDYETVSRNAYSWYQQYTLDNQINLILKTCT